VHQRGAVQQSRPIHWIDLSPAGTAKDKGSQKLPFAFFDRCVRYFFLLFGFLTSFFAP
jgi:hypothetical protein